MSKFLDGKKILIVDDNEKNIQLIGDYLKSNGKFISIVATDGQEAIDRTTNSKPDLILMDINMPVMDGVEACEKIKKQEELKDIPIIFLTAQNSIEDKIKALEAKGNDFIAKPFYEEELILRLKLHLEFAESKKEIKRSLEKTNEMLDNIGQSFFWIDKNGIVLSPSSRTTDKVMGQNIEGQSILNTLYKGLEATNKKEINSFLEKSSTIKKDKWEEFQKKLPSKVEYYNENEKKEKILYANYKPFWTNENNLSKIMFILDDKTEIDFLIDQKNIYSIKMVSSISGVQENTLRSWEKRHQAVTPFRNSKGKRFYNENELERIKLIKLAIDLGMNISSLAHLDIEQLKKISDKAKEDNNTQSDQNQNVENINLESAAHNIDIAITNKNYAMLGHELNKLANYPEMFDFVFKFFPIIFKGLKEKIESGKLNQEELKSITTYFKVNFNHLIFKNKKNSEKAIISFFDNPHWELEVFQTAFICIENNLDPIICGEVTNGKENSNYLKSFQANYLILSCGSEIKNNTQAVDELIKTTITNIESDKNLIITGNLNYSENKFMKYENLIPLPTIKNLDTGLKKMNKNYMEDLYKKSS